MKSKNNIIAPKYFESFKCIGGECEDSCCIGWDIDIDRLTFRQYYRVKDTNMLDKFKNHVFMNEECYDTEVDYGRVKVNEQKWCPFLDEDKYCNIYKNLGEDYLSNVCSSFPRVINSVNGQLEVSLFLSCPQAARLVLLNKEKISYQPSKVKLGKHIITARIDTTDKDYKGTLVEDYLTIREDITHLLQNRELSIESRLFELGKYIEVMLGANGYYKFNTADITESIGKEKMTKKLKGNPTLHISYFKTLIEDLSPETIDSKEFIQYTESIKETLFSNTFNSQKDMVLAYEKAARYHIDNNRELLDQIFENELVNYMYQNLFPLSETQEPFERYIMLVIRFALMRFYLIGMYEVSGKVTTQDTLLIISKFTKSIDHHRLFLDFVYEYMKEMKFDHLSFAKDLLFF